MNKLYLLYFLLFFLFSCAKTDLSEPSFTYGNLQKNNNHEGKGKILATVPIVEETIGSDLNNFAGNPLSIPGNYLISSTGQNTIALLRGRRIEWEYSLLHGHYPVSSYAYYDKKIYFMGSDTSIYSLNLNGQLQAKTVIKDAKSIIFSDPIAYKDNIYIASFDGHVYKFDNKLKLIKSIQIEGKIEKQIVLSDEKIILNNSFHPDSDRLLIYDLDLNEVSKFEVQESSEIYSFPVASDSSIIFFQRVEIREENLDLEESKNGIAPTSVEFLGVSSVVFFEKLKTKVSTNKRIESNIKYAIKLIDKKAVYFDKNDKLI